MSFIYISETSNIWKDTPSKKDKALRKTRLSRGFGIFLVYAFEVENPEQNFESRVDLKLH